MSYTRFALGFPRNRKVASLSDSTFRLWASAMDHAREQLTDGELTEADLDLIPRCPTGKARTAAIEELVTSGLWEVNGDGWMIHDFLDWQDSAAQVKSKKRAARDRMRKVRDPFAAGSQNVRANRERTSGEVREKFDQQIISLSSSCSDSDPSEDQDSPESLRSSEASSPGAVSGAFPTANPHDLASALEFPLKERAQFCLRDPMSGSFCRPESWPETLKAAKILGDGCGLEFFVGPFPRDKGTEAILLLFASGITLENLEIAASMVSSNDWFRTDRSRRHLSSFSPKVVTRLLASVPAKASSAPLTELEGLAKAQREERQRKAAQASAGGQRK
jgi:hypothetical protein